MEQNTTKLAVLIFLLLYTSNSICMSWILQIFGYTPEETPKEEVVEIELKDVIIPLDPIAQKILDTEIQDELEKLDAILHEDSEKTPENR